ncbi:MAG: flagellar motor switch protein FliM [Deltaproteobacteria bacterium RBG_13_58_19]|nr:MAG: flagellar motor switch protein FliM [Deltaproteobacteria bacterium RBG_13_58_19]
MTKVLSQEEVDALLKGLVEGEIETEVEQHIPEGGVTNYDFASQERIIRGRMPTLEVINEHFARAFRISLSMILRRTVDIQTNFVQMLKFGEFLRSLPLPSSFNIFKADPLRGQCLMVVDSKLVFSLVECFLGGSAKTRFKIEGRDFTTIERRLIHKVVLMAFHDLEKSWAPVHPVKMQSVRTEINPMFVGIATPNDIMVISKFQVEMEQAEGFITVVMPYATVEPIKGKLYSGFQSEQLELDSRWAARIISQIQDMEVNVVVELGTTTMTAQSITNLAEGDVILFDKKVTEPLMARVEGIPKFTGFAGQVYNAKGFQIQKRLYPQH